MLKKFSVKTYIRSNESISSLRIDYILALIPAMIWSIVHFGFKALTIFAISVVSVVVSDIIVNLICSKRFISPSLHIVFCGILFSLTLYSETEALLCMIGAALIPLFFHLFGNERKCTFFVPLICRELAILLVPNGINIPENLPINNILKETIPEENITELILGLRAGMLGSISILAVLLGAFYLLFRKTADFKASAAYIIAYITLSLAFPAIEARGVESTIYELIASDLLFVAFFVLTDYNITPSKSSYRYLKGIICAVIAFVLRMPDTNYNAYFIAVIIVDMLAPLFNTLLHKIKIAKEKTNAK